MNAQRYLLFLVTAFVPLLGFSREISNAEHQHADSVSSEILRLSSASKPISDVSQLAPTVETVPRVESALVSQVSSETAVHPLDGLTIALDIGHTRKFPGAYSARGRGEFYFNQDIVERLAPMLRQLGATVRVINHDGTLVSLSERTAKARQMKADLFVSIHHDSVNPRYKKVWKVDGKVREYSDRYSGFSVFFSSKNRMPRRSEELAESIGESMLNYGLKPTLHHAERIKGENRPIIRKDIGLYDYSDLIVLKTARIPAALVECGVIVHREEEAALRQPATQHRISHAITDGIVRYWKSYGE